MLGLYLTRARFSVTSLRGNHEVGGIFFAVLGTAYGVLLSFVVVAAWTRYQVASQAGVQEATDLGSMFWLSSALPDAVRQRVQDELRDYTTTVINVEWPLMADNRESNQAWTVSDELWLTVLDFKPQSQHEQTIYGDLLSQRESLDRDRRHRLLTAQDQIPDTLWIVMDVGALMTIIFTYHFGMQRFFPQAVMTGALTGLIVLVLLLVYQLDNPYQGFARVTPRGFTEVVQLLNQPPRAPSALTLPGPPSSIVIPGQDPAGAH